MWTCPHNPHTPPFPNPSPAYYALSPSQPFEALLYIVIHLSLAPCLQRDKSALTTHVQVHATWSIQLEISILSNQGNREDFKNFDESTIPSSTFLFLSVLVDRTRKTAVRWETKYDWPKYEFNTRSNFTHVRILFVRDKETRNEMKQQLESFADASDAINYNAISRPLWKGRMSANTMEACKKKHRSASFCSATVTLL